MNITLCSAFRNSTPYLARYFNQINDLDYALHSQGHKLQLVWGEGDSSDGTLTMLKGAQFRFRAQLVDCTHGGAEHGSVVSAERFRQLAHVGNTILQAVPEETDALLWVESDLIWHPATLLGLPNRLSVYPAVCPKILLKRAGWPAYTWYDTWAFRLDGKHFDHRRPYHPAHDGVSILRIDSGGSCMAIRGELAQKVSFPEEDVFVGLSRQLYEHGGSLWLDPTISVTHT